MLKHFESLGGMEDAKGNTVLIYQCTMSTDMWYTHAEISNVHIAGHGHLIVLLCHCVWLLMEALLRVIGLF